MLVAEKRAKFGLPEILFNLFPGMGAFSFLSRKLDMTRAHKMILSGRVFGAPELYEMGLIDILAEDGRGEEAVRDYIAQNRRHHAVHRRVREVGLRVNPLSLEELRDVTDIWAEHAMRLQEIRPAEHGTAGQRAITARAARQYLAHYAATLRPVIRVRHARPCARAGIPHATSGGAFRR